MSEPARILIVEDLEEDFELAQLEIRRSVKECAFERVETRQDLLNALETFQPDVILSDYNMPRFDGMTALKLAKEQAPLTPFIIWTGSLSEDIAVECMKAGANNYILKENLKRLGPAIMHSIDERQLLLERRETEDKLRRSEMNYRTLTENSVQGIAIFQNSRMVYANPAICTIMGYTAEELMEMSEDQILALTHPDDLTTAQERTKRRRAGESVAASNDLRILRKDGTIRWIQTFSNSIEYNGQPAVLSTSIDITERKQAEQKYQNILENSPEGIFQSTPEGRFIHINPAMARIYGYDSPQDMIESITNIATQLYIEPEDRNKFTRLFQLNDQVEKFEMKNFRKDGSIIWTNTSARAVRDANGNILYYEGFLQDITERKLAEQKIRESEERFRALIENSLDNISLLAADGTLLWENPAANRPLGYKQDELLNRNIFELMHPDDIGWTGELFTKVTKEPGGQQRGTFQLKHQDGTWRWIEATATNMLNDPSVNAVVINYRDVTEGKQAEVKLHDARELFQKSFNLSPVATMLSNISQRVIVDVNNATETLFGYSRSELVGETSTKFDFWANARERQEVFDTLLQQGQIADYEFSFRKKSGEVGRAILAAEIIEQHGDKYILTTYVDISQRTLAEVEIKQRNDDLQLINAINEAAIHSVSLDGIVNLLAKEMKRIFSITGSTLYMLNPDGRSLTMQQFILPQEITRRIEKVIGSTIPLIQIPIQEGGYFQKVLNKTKGTITSDPKEIQDWMAEFVETTFLPPAARGAIRKLIPQIFKILNIKSTIMVPLLSDGKAIGLLDVSNSGLFTEDDLRRIEKISGQLTAAIQRQQANEQVRRSQEFLQSVQNALSASIAILNEEGVVVQVNTAWRKFGEQNDLQHTGYCVGLNYLDICDSATGQNAEEAQVVAQAIRDVIAGHRREIQVEYPCHSPEEKRWYTLRITKFDDGDHIWVVMAHENITERKQFENALQVSEARYRLISENSTDVIWTLDLATQRFTYISPSVMRLRGLTPQEVMAEPLQAALTPDSYQFVVTNLPVRIQAFLAGDESALSYVTEIDQTRKDGSIVPTEVVTTLLIDANGMPVEILGVTRDITERKQAEKLLKETNEQFRTLFEASPEGIILIDPHDDWPILDCNEAACAMNGYKRDELVGQPLDILTLTPGDPAKRLEYMEKVREVRVLHYDDYHRRKDGTIFPIAISTSLITLGGREVVLGIDRDITDRKRAEDALRKSEAVYRQAMEVAGAVPYYESYYDNGKEIKYEFIGEGIRQITGYGPEEFNAKLWDSLVEEVNLVEELRGYSMDDGIQRVRSGENPIWKCEHRIRARDGSIHWVFEAAVELRDEHGVSHGSIGTYQDITARKVAEEEVRKANEKYRNIFENALESIHQTTPDGRYITANPATAHMLGYETPEELMANVTDLQHQFYVDASRRDQFKTLLEEYGVVSGFESEVYRRDGVTIWVSENVRAIRDEQGHLLYYEGTSQDITERKRAEEAERDQRALAEALRDTAETLNSTLEYGEVLDRILAAVGRVVPHNAATIMLIDGEFAHVVRSHGYEQRSYQDEITGVKLSLAETDNLRQILETRQPVIVYDTHAYTGWKRLAITDWLRSNVGVPISIYGEVIGFILLDSETIGFFTPVHAERLKAFANQAALAIHNARLLQQAQDEIAERMQAEAELRQSESRYRTVVENQTEFIVRWMSNGTRTFVNDAYCRYFGLTHEQALNTEFMPLVHEEDRAVVEEKISRLLSGSIRMETDTHRVIKPDGSIGWQEWTDQAIYGDNGQLIEFQSVGRDITERKQAEKELREEQEKVQKYLDIAAVMMLALDRDGNVSLINQKGCEILGYSDDEIIGKNWINSFVPEPMRDEMQDIFQKLMQEDGESLLYYENPVLTKNGEERMIAWHNNLVRDENGRIITSLSSGEDITERRRAEEALRESEEKYRLLFDSNPLPMWIYDIETLRFLKVNNAAIDHYGYSEAEFMAMTIKDIRPPADIPRLIENISQITDGMDKAGIWPHIKKDGSVIQVEIISYVVEFEGRLTELILANDVTERLTAERELRASEERFRQLADNIQEVFWMTDAVSGEELYISPASEKIWGRSMTSMLHDPNIFLESILQEDRPHVLEKLEEQRNGEATDMEYRILHSDGSVHWVWDRAFPIFDETGRTARLAGIAADITERKRIEEEAQRHVAELEALYENGLAVGRLLNPREIGERVIATFARYLSWHHVTIRLIQPESDNLEMIAFSLPGLNENEKSIAEHHFKSKISKIGQGMSGWVAQTGMPVRTGNVHDHPQYVDTQAGIQSGLYMPLKIGERILGVISVESETPDAFTSQDERLLATLATQAAIAFENARLYQTNQQERERFSELFENTPVATWLEDFSAVISWMDGLRKQGITNLKEYLQGDPESYKLGISLIDILDVNHAAVVMNGARDKDELLERVHALMMEETPSQVMINEMELIWRGYTSFGFEMSSQRLDGTTITGIQRIYIPIANNEPDYSRVIVTNTDITDRVDFEKRLRTSEVHYRELADSITDVFFELDQELHFSHWNKASEILTGFSAEHAIGKSMLEVFGESFGSGRIEQVFQDVRETYQPRTFETIIPLNNQSRTFEINAYPSTRGVAVVAKDVTERKLSESLMQKRFELMEYSAEHELEDLMQKALDEISEWTHSTIGFFQFIQGDQITPSLQVWSTDTFEHFHSSDVEEMHKPADQAGVWAEAIRQRRAIIHNDYASLPGKKGLPESHAPLVRELVVPIIRNEKIVAVIGIGNKSQDYTRDDLERMERFADYAWDVIERKQMVTELAEERNQLARRVEERTSDLSRANSNLARALRVKDEFLASMSHELRTPLNAILGLSESLGEQIAGPLNEKQQKYLNTISESGHHLLSLINDILDLAKIEAGQITLDINKVDVNLVSQASLRMIKQLAQKKNLDVVVEIDEKIGLMWADERRLKQMMVNLLSNAVKFTPEGGKLGLQIQGHEEDNKVMITIWDTGIGIKESDFQRLFQPFVQLDSGLAREATGTGLGLALVAQMARLHGGSVNVSSEPGKGSRFTIVLPWQAAQAMTIAEKLKVTGKFRAVKDGQGPQTILLVEDTQEVVMMIKDYLEIAGYKVVTAQDGLDGITQARLSHPDLILMDVQMPRMDGLEATQKLRQDPNFKNTPILALTALAMPNDRDRCLAAGMDEYISKPVNLRALVKIIQSCLSIREEKTTPR